MIALSRIYLFVNRWLKAKQYGFAYLGTTKTIFPKKLEMLGKRIPLVEPLGSECVYDLFNVLLDDEYGLGKMPRHPKIIVDIGVNMGIFSLMAWSMFPEAEIYGYEPNPLALQKARQNLRTTQVTLYGEAVGRLSGMCDIQGGVQSRLARAIVSEQGAIPVTPLSEVLQRAGGAIDLLKMDCEGAEWEILEDYDSLRAIHFVRMEYHLVNGRSLDDFKRLVGKGGHRIVNMVSHGNHGIAWLQRIS